MNDSLRRSLSVWVEEGELRLLGFVLALEMQMKCAQHNWK